MTPDVRARARKIRLVAMDVDGVLTDAGMYYTENGDELKKFNTRDGMGVALVREAGLKTAILTREHTRWSSGAAPRCGSTTSSSASPTS